MTTDFIFITGIDTDIGKTIATGMIARFLHQRGETVITQKMVQTGCENLSEDIVMHRTLMECDLNEQDRAAITCPYLFRHPASPHLAASLENQTIDVRRIDDATGKLAQHFSTILIEGAGGLQVPLNDEVTLLDYMAEKGYPVILVTSSRLGSINHTLLSIEALKHRGLKLQGLVYNTADETDRYITADSIEVIRRFIKKNRLNAPIIKMGVVNVQQPEDIDFGAFFNPDHFYTA